MKKNEVRLFFLSFFVSLLIFGFCVLFLSVDANGSRLENDGKIAAFRLENIDILEYKLFLLGKSYDISLRPLNEISLLRHKYPTLLTSRRVLNADQIFAICAYEWQKFNE